MAAYRYQHGDQPLDGYTIERAVGRGGFGEVYFARSDSGREVALKSVQGYEDIELRGISHCMNLKSPHLVSIFDIKRQVDGEPFVIMEYVSGPSLRELLDESPAGLGPQKASFFLREIAKGLTYLHDCGIVHRDLKPGNIFFEDGYVKIGDYGLSKAITQSMRSAQTVTVGTVHYMAPEIGEGRYDRSIDIYALGIMLYEMLTGQTPYFGATPTEVLMKHLSATPDLTQVEEPFKTVIGKALAKDPAERYASVQEMVEAVFGAAHVRRSVSHFRPESLSMAAGRVGGRVQAGVAGAGAGTLDKTMNRPGVRDVDDDSNTRFGPVEGSAQVGDRLGRMAEHIGERMDRLGDHLTAGARGRGESRDHEARKRQPDFEALDPMPHRQRMMLAVLASAILALGSAAFARSYGSPTGGTLFYASFLLIFLGALGAWVGRVKADHRLRRHAKWVQRLLMSGMVIGFGAIGAVVWSTLAGVSFDWAPVMVVLALLIDWRRLTDPYRGARFSMFGIGLVAVVSMIAVAIANGPAALIAAQFAGAAMVAQTMCPFVPLERRRKKADRKDRTARADEAAQERPRVSAHAQAHAQADPHVNAHTAAPSMKASPLPRHISPRRRGIALALAIVGFIPGIAGLQRFYVGKIGTGLLYLFTGGLFYVGQTIDLIRVAGGDFTDSDGRRLLLWDNRGELGMTSSGRGHSENHRSGQTHSAGFVAAASSLVNVAMSIAGYALVFSAVMVAMLVALDLPGMIAAGVIDEQLAREMSQELGASWPNIARSLGTLMSTIVFGAGVIVLILARRRAGALHLLRLMLGAVMLGVLMVAVHSPVAQFSMEWPVIANLIHQQNNPSAAIEYGLSRLNAGTMMFVLGVFIAAIVALAWPPARVSIESRRAETARGGAS